MTSLDFQSLYRLSDPLANSPLRLAPDPEWADHEKSTRLFRGKWAPLTPVVLRTSMGGQPRDFLWTTFPPLLCVSQTVVDLLERQKLTGWSTYPVEVHGREGQPLTGYHGFAITGRGGSRDRSRSEIIIKPPPAPRGKSYQVYKGLYFDESQWDGSDIFLVDGRKVVTQQVCDEFRRAKVTNVRFTSLTDVETDVYLDRYS